MKNNFCFDFLDTSHSRAKDSQFSTPQQMSSTSRTFIASMASSLFGHDAQIVSSVDEDVAVIKEGVLLFHTGLSWRENYFKLVWRDELQNSAMLLRYKSRTDDQPVHGDTGCMLLSTIRTLIPIEPHELEIRLLTRGRSKSVGGPSSTSSLSSSSSGSSSSVKPEKFRFAIDTLDGTSILLAATSIEARFEWTHILYKILIQQAQNGAHQDPSIIDGIRVCEAENQRQRDVAAEIDAALVQPSAENPSAAVVPEGWPAPDANSNLEPPHEGDLLEFDAFQ